MDHENQGDQMKRFAVGANDITDFSDGNLPDSIDFDDLSVLINDGDALPDLEMDSENLAELCACGGGEKVEDNAKNEKEYEVSGSGSGLNSSSSRGDQDIVSKRDGSVVMNQPIKEADKGRKSPTKSKISQGKRKVKVDWTPELHMRFVQAVEQVGVDKAVPSRILELMGIERLNRHNIASHLQKYRSSHRKHLVAREAEATNWSKTREMNGQATGGVGRRDTSPWQAPTCMGFPPITPMHHFRPLLVWGHPTMDQSLMPMMWPKHRADHPPSPPSPAWAPVSWPPLRDPLHDWHPHQQSAPNVLNRGTPCFPQPILPTPRHYVSPPVSGIQPHTIYKVDPNIGAPTRQLDPNNPILDIHPTKESIDAAIGDVISKPWLPLPLGLKPPSDHDGVLVELQRHGVLKIPSSHA
ncbi:hypothetical protein F2P56_022517 [Juglans regia]|uniref:Transcription activator GLK2-like n=2 Tax=Juglans regia TaxID=51240 RepID=A0A2I4GHU2_JUGRE|nr:transcription activator GLK2-like [Juglans regia]KAF5458493.1 hypothetical protein F2P56_022517 [Juglans regia]